MSAHRYTRGEVNALIVQALHTYALRLSAGEQAKPMTMGIMNTLMDSIEADVKTWVRCTDCQRKHYYPVDAPQPTTCERCGESLPKVNVMPVPATGEGA